MKRNGKVGGELKKAFFSAMLRIRKVEEKIADVYTDGQMRTPTHLSIGQEAVAVGVCAALNNVDQIFCSHRCHAHYLAKGGELNALFAELCGRVDGCSEGRGGSAHLTDIQAGVFASPILGAMIPVAVGAALSFKMDNTKQVAVAFFGDAAIEEGAFSESFNFAVLHHLPVLFVCENNLYSTHTHLKSRQPASSIHSRVSTPELKARQADGNDVEEVYQLAHQEIEKCRIGKGPAFIEFLTYRIREHVGPLFDYDKGYRSKSEVESWIRKCPIKRLGKKLLRQNTISQKEIRLISEKVEQEAMEAYEKALRSPWPKTRTLLNHVY